MFFIIIFYLCLWGKYLNMAKQSKKGTSVGRKKLPKGEKKIGVSLYIKADTVKEHGGRTKLAEKILNECEFLQD